MRIIDSSDITEATNIVEKVFDKHRDNLSLQRMANNEKRNEIAASLTRSTIELLKGKNK